MWILLGIGLLLLVGYIVYTNSQYLLDMQQRKENQRTQKKLFEVHYKYARERYGLFNVLWKEHQKICPYGCDKR